MVTEISKDTVAKKNKVNFSHTLPPIGNPGQFLPPLKWTYTSASKMAPPSFSSSTLGRGKSQESLPMSAEVQPRLIQGIRSGDGVGKYTGFN